MCSSVLAVARAPRPESTARNGATAVDERPRTAQRAARSGAEHTPTFDLDTPTSASPQRTIASDHDRQPGTSSEFGAVPLGGARARAARPTDRDRAAAVPDRRPAAAPAPAALRQEPLRLRANTAARGDTPPPPPARAARPPGRQSCPTQVLSQSRSRSSSSLATPTTSSTSRSRTPISRELVRVIGHHRQALHLRRQAPQHQGDRLRAAEGHRRRGLPGLPLDPRHQRPHRHPARPLPEDRRVAGRRDPDDAHLAPRSRVPAEDRYVTRIHRLAHICADEVANAAHQVQDARTPTSPSTCPATCSSSPRPAPTSGACSRSSTRSTSAARATRSGSSRSTTRRRTDVAKRSTRSSISRAAARRRAPGAKGDGGGRRRVAPPVRRPARREDRRRRAPELAHHRRDRARLPAHPRAHQADRRPAVGRGRDARPAAAARGREELVEDAQRDHRGAGAPAPGAAAARGRPRGGAARPAGHLRGRRRRSAPTRRPTRSSSPRRSATTAAPRRHRRARSAAAPGLHRGRHHRRVG